MPPPLVAPIFAEGREPLPPGWTEDDRKVAMETRKWEKWVGYGMESCLGKSVMSGVIGTGLGMAFSLMGTAFSVETSFANGTNPISTKQYFKEMGQKMWRSGRGFGKVGALYAGTECVIESILANALARFAKYRAKNDITNAVAAGFVTGGILARNSGPTAALGGGVAFAAFSAAIDLFMRRETPE